LFVERGNEKAAVPGKGDLLIGKYLAKIPRRERL